MFVFALPAPFSGELTLYAMFPRNQILKRVILIFILLTFSVKTYSQTTSNEGLYSNIDSRILIGKWYPIDTSGNIIEFTDSSDGFKLKVENAQLYFFTKDSSGYISSYGYYPQWPPPSCDLKLVSNDTLKATYSYSMGGGVSFLYTKKRK